MTENFILNETWSWTPFFWLLSNHFEMRNLIKHFTFPFNRAFLFSFVAVGYVFLAKMAFAWSREKFTRPLACRDSFFFGNSSDNSAWHVNYIDKRLLLYMEPLFLFLPLLSRDFPGNLTVDPLLNKSND